MPAPSPIMLLAPPKVEYCTSDQWLLDWLTVQTLKNSAVIDLTPNLVRIYFTEFGKADMIRGLPDAKVVQLGAVYKSAIIQFAYDCMATKLSMILSRATDTLSKTQMVDCLTTQSAYDQIQQLLALRSLPLIASYSRRMNLLEGIVQSMSEGLTSGKVFLSTWENGAKSQQRQVKVTRLTIDDREALVGILQDNVNTMLRKHAADPVMGFRNAMRNLEVALLITAGVGTRTQIARYGTIVPEVILDKAVAGRWANTELSLRIAQYSSLTLKELLCMDFKKVYELPKLTIQQDAIGYKYLAMLSQVMDAERWSDRNNKTVALEQPAAASAPTPVTAVDVTGSSWR